ncbi:hypothetical protein ASPZODRAFT_125074 [Penicilliopsis zonata CBS 506.65]|uniref:Altered inheritance of mitochondria protein 41 n=1 Tax=Penicilliopsis zonata CBS 506.65 TaxID=1073090 RepID=A0A1L9S6A1_9EURO|nr:hypothetical protein ASPZODRAFT_125074 [Penicilliopsis zonata CBS 506.65]OJJ42698.1 hypothetical protein ASPZODRAFT_125074 [Penicilliopsis zonata CBS 506.65]
MGKIRADLKTAMRAKDTVRLTVLRALISETNNAAKTSSPIQTDLQLLSLIRKRTAASREAGEQFAAADRADLKEKEDAQVAVLEEYAGQVETMDVAEIEAIVAQQIAALKDTDKKVEVGAVLKALFAPGGALDGKPAERAVVARIAKEGVKSV